QRHTRPELLTVHDRSCQATRCSGFPASRASQPGPASRVAARGRRTSAVAAVWPIAAAGSWTAVLERLVATFGLLLPVVGHPLRVLQHRQQGLPLLDCRQPPKDAARLELEIRA